MINFKTCNHSPTFIYSDGSVNYYAADEEGAEEFSGNLIINLTTKPSTKAVATTYKIPQLSKHMLSLPEEIVLGWIDFSTPPVKSSFWKALHKYCKDKSYKDVCFRCGYGHGRTGTALASMLIANKQMDAESAIHMLRDQYCKQAVESQRQIIYLIDLDCTLNDVPFPDEDKINEIILRLFVKPTQNTIRSSFFE